ncbi:hypothetical protein [Actinomadura madurae]|uniref:hypothetical protein n=1 Tax=Actinomadura madurae TaxID=1993 RepID=UPI0011BE5BDF|nr:hypothetical protein [Actinomadura madurae]
MRWRTRLGRATAIRNLDLLAVALQARSHRCVKLYQADEFPGRPPLLWVFAFSPDDHVRVVVNVQAVPGGRAYHEAGRGRHGYLCPCGDVKDAAEQVDSVLKHRMFPSTWLRPEASR